MAATYEPIATTTLNSTASGITFSSIPNTYTDLKLIILYSTLNPNNELIRFNSDSGTNYSFTTLYGNGSSASSSVYSNTDSLRVDIGIGGTTPNSTDVAFVTVDIFNYSGSTYKPCLISTSGDFNGSGISTKTANVWRSTAAINTIYFYSNSSSNLVTGTKATLYGIKAA